MFLKINNSRKKLFFLIYIFVCFFTIVFIMSDLSFKADAKAEETSNITISSVFGANANNSKYTNNSYLSYYKIPSSDVKSVQANGGFLEVDKTQFLASNVIDENTKTFWYSKEENTDSFKNSLEFSFVNEKNIESFYYSSSYYTRDKARLFSGYPMELKVYTSLNDSEYELVGTCLSSPVKDFSEEVIFTLSRSIKCNKIKLEFSDVSVVTGIADWLNGKKFAAACDIFFFKPDEGIEFSTAQNATGDFANTTYLAANSVSASEMKFRANGAGEVANAFDKNVGTYWTSESANTDLFKNKITITFNNTVTLKKIVMGLSFYTRNGNRNYSGYPKVFKIYTAQDSQADVTLKKVYSGEPANWNMACFDLGEDLTCKKMVLEFTELTVFSEIADGAPVACTSEIYLVRGTDESVNETLEKINAMFSDYAQLSLKPEYTIEKINEFREVVKNNSSYESILKPMLDRAEAVLNGAVRKDIYREFSTDPNAKNTILRMGDLRGYCANTLKHSSFGTNRQVTGIAANTGEKLTVYVDAEDGDPLPKIVCTQIYGAWNSWKAEYQLHKGKNEIVFPNLKAHGNYSRSIAPGGPIHIVNPYEENQQSANVKIYIEGGALYPVFRDGDDEETFKMILENYYSRLIDPNDSGVTVDCFEAVTGNVMLSCTASIAYNSYVKGGSSPQYNIDKWRRYITGLLKFGGVELDPQGQYYNIKNEYIKVNIRAVQPYAGMYAFAAADHVGIIDSATFGAMVQMWTTGWAFAHEVGHMLDNMNMKRPEITNNMWAIYDIYMQNGAFNDRINVTNVSKNLASDFSGKVGNYWANGNSNCDFWWIIEGGHPGYWAKLQQLYCFDNRGNDLKDLTERLAYYSSIATGEDMTEYFDRWGFYLTGETRFSASKVSDTYKQKMAEAKSKGWVTGNGKKYWYVNNEQYRLEKAHEGKLDASWASCYDSSQTITAQITLAGNNYSIRLPEPSNATAHLCYEIQGYIDGAWKVLGITYGTMFNDTYAYKEGVTPKYRIYAYDRMLNHTGDPVEQIPAEQERQFDVCRINDVKYNSLKEAVEAAKDGDTIYLLKDFSDGGIRITNKSITIAIDSSVDKDSITIKKNVDGDLITVVRSGNNNVVVNINEKNATKKIILDGGEFLQNGSLLKASGAEYKPGEVWVYNTVLCNNWNNANGGAAYLGYVGRLYFVNCEIKNNRAKNGAGAFLEGSHQYYNTQLALFNVIFENNIAKENGGAIYSSSINGTVNTVNVTSNNDPAYSQVIMRGNKAVNGGGIYADNIINLRFLTLENNIATGKGGGIYFARVNNTLNTATVKNNTSGDGKSDAFYLGNTTLTLASGTINGSIEKSDKATLNITTAMPNLTNAIFHLPSIAAEGTILVNTVTGFTPTDEQIKTMTIANANAQMEETTIKAISKIAEITINGANTPLKIQVPFGKFILPERVEGLSENQYIEGWLVNGKNYDTQDQIEITGNMTVTANVKNYHTIILEYGSKSMKLKVTQDYTYYLPMKTPDGDVVFGWSLDNVDYAYAEGIKVTKDITLKAIVKVKFTVKTDILGEITTSQYDYGSSYVLSTAPLMLGKAFSHWEVNGDKYLPNSTLTVSGNLNIKACYTATWNVTRIIEDEESTKAYADGTEIILDHPGKSLEREFVYWSINGVKYYAGAKYIINSDTEMQAVFLSSSRLSSKLKITLIFNRGASKTEDEDNSEIQENETEEINVSFNSEYTFKEIKVNDGYAFLYWEVNGAKYYPGDRISVTASFTANASVVEKALTEPEEGSVKITLEMYKDGKIVETVYYKLIGEEIFLGNIEDEGNKKFLYWEVNGQEMKDDSFIVEKETVVKAVYETDDINSGEIPGGENENTHNTNNHMMLIIGIAIGVILFVIVGVILVFVIRKKRK